MAVRGVERGVEGAGGGGERIGALGVDILCSFCSAN